MPLSPYPALALPVFNVSRISRKGRRSWDMEAQSHSCCWTPAVTLTIYQQPQWPAPISSGWLICSETKAAPGPCSHQSKWQVLWHVGLRVLLHQTHRRIRKTLSATAGLQTIWAGGNVPEDKVRIFTALILYQASRKLSIGVRDIYQSVPFHLHF